MIIFSSTAQRRVHGFVMLLYIAVLLGSVMHTHGHEYDPLSRPEFKNTPGEESTHHSSTLYSACYIVGFAGTQSIEFRNEISDGVTCGMVIVQPGTQGETKPSLLGAQPLRGPPTV